jgi:hypothetical protein
MPDDQLKKLIAWLTHPCRKYRGGHCFHYGGRRTYESVCKNGVPTGRGKLTTGTKQCCKCKVVKDSPSGYYD